MDAQQLLQVRLIDLTTEDLIRIIAETVRSNNKQIFEHIESRMNGGDRTASITHEEPLYGIEGIAQALHCSTTKAQTLKSEGMLEGGYQQIGKTIIVRDAKALADIAAHNIAKKKQAKKNRRTNKSIIN